MTSRNEFVPAAERRLAAPAPGPAASSLQVPRQNRILAALTREGRAALLVDLEPVALPLEWALHDSRDPPRYVYFPTAGIVSMYCDLESGAGVEFATTGSEGLVGVSTFLGGTGLPGRAVVAVAGHGYRLHADRLHFHVMHDAQLAHRLLAYTQALMTQIAQITVCNRLHSVEQQLCRKILWSLDALGSDEMPITHELLGRMLGVRRESVSQAAGTLHELGLIDHGRGHLAVLDRVGLEARACECYAVLRREYARLLPAPDGRVFRPAA